MGCPPKLNRGITAKRCFFQKRYVTRVSLFNTFAVATRESVLKLESLFHNWQSVSTALQLPLQCTKYELLYLLYFIYVNNNNFFHQVGPAGLIVLARKSPSHDQFRQSKAMFICLHGWHLCLPWIANNIGNE